MRSLRTIVFLSAAFAAVPAFPAGLQFTEVTSSGAQGGTTKIQMVVDGQHFRATFVENSQGIPPVGTYLVGTGEGEIFIVSPATKAYARFDRGQFSGMAQQAAGMMSNAKQQAAAHGMTRSIENYKLEKLVDEPGPTTFGVPTRHYQYRISYQDVTRMAGAPMAMTTNFEEVREFWSTTAFGETAKVPDMGAMMSTGDEGADKGAAAEREMAQHGMMLKSITTSKGSQGGMMAMMNPLAKLGGSHGANKPTTHEIVALDRVEPPPGTFDLPKDYQETDMMSLFTAAGGQMPDLNALGGPGSKPAPAMPDLNKMGQ